MIAISCPETLDISSFPVSSLQVSFSDDRPDITLHPGGEGSVIDVGHVNSTPIEEMADLKMTGSRQLLIRGEIQCDRESVVEVRLQPQTMLMTDHVREALAGRVVLEYRPGLHAGGVVGVDHRLWKGVHSCSWLVTDHFVSAAIFSAAP